MANLTVHFSELHVDPFVSNATITVYRYVMIGYVWPTVVVFGIASNIVNIIVYSRIIPKDSVSISFLALSVSDLIHLLIISLQIFGSICYLVVGIGHVYCLDPVGLYIVFYWYAYLFYDASTFITVFIAIARCCCIAVPFHFKNMFTKSRTVVILMTMPMAAVFLRLPMLRVHRLAWVSTPSTNISLIAVEVIGDKDFATTVNDIIAGTIIPFTSYFTILLCLAVLTLKLRAASNFRASVSVAITRQINCSDPNSNTTGSVQCQNELRVIRSVAAVSTVFIVLTTPFMCYHLARRIKPKFTAGQSGGLYFNLFNLMTTLSQTCGLLNASINAFVYYRCNSKYRKTFRLVILRKKSNT